MTNGSFRRGLDCEFVDKLNDMYESGGWWRNFIDDDELFLAIRNNYVNVYYRGNSILKLNWKKENRTVSGEIHYKYLLRPSIEGHHYVNIGESGVAQYKDVKNLFFEDILDVQGIKLASKHFAGREKPGVHSIALEDSNRVLDLEIAFGEGTGAPRIDLASLKSTDHGVEMKFFEAKHFKNDELKALGNNDPEVLDQMQKYAHLLSTNRVAIIESYCRICKNFVSLRGLSERHPARHRMLSYIFENEREITVNGNPELLVFGFDQDQKEGRNWRLHREKLIDRLKGRVQFMGVPASIRLN